MGIILYREIEITDGMLEDCVDTIDISNEEGAMVDLVEKHIAFSEENLMNELEIDLDNYENADFLHTSFRRQIIQKLYEDLNEHFDLEEGISEEEEISEEDDDDFSEDDDDFFEEDDE